MSAPNKITPSHLSRKAMVYVRQSTMAQVREHTESTARQYALVEEAARLGWAAAHIEVIDCDLGLSGRSADHRSGYRDVVSRVCLGEVGAIFGLEISRLARSSADLARLLELARLTDTLIIDADGIYDLRDFNDRLLLGLKSTMSEAELHLLAGRMQGARRAAAARGELRFPLPVGYVRDVDGHTVIDTDQEVAAAIADVFAAFQATGSAYAVVATFKQRRFPRRAYGGAWSGELRWGRLTYSRVLSILSNPAYAGAYVFGRYRKLRIVAADGTVREALREQPRPEWEVVIQDHHSGYLSWEQYLLNQQRLAANATCSGARPPREGAALCQGIVYCGSCARAMSTRYRLSGRADYDCAYSRGDRVATPACRSINAATVDHIVATRLLQVLGPEEVALALAAADEVAERRGRATRASELAVERARFDADRAERAFHACEPENRLVARTLESRWEMKLGALAEVEAALATVKASLPTLPPRAELEALAADLPALWSAPSTSDKDRKRLLRTLVADVTLTSEAGDELRIGVRWRSGATELITTRRPAPFETLRTPQPAADLIIQLGPSMSDQELVRELNARGLKTGAGRPFDVAAVKWVRYTHHVPCPSPLKPGELRVDAVAARLGISVSAVYYWIEHGQLPARHCPSGKWCVSFTPEVETACRTRIANSHQLRAAVRRLPAGEAV
jgi:DNA invertase Pin-like site-specific DNA recombinase/predicted DNA-binding transcriptional regulator AlpA